MSLHALKQREFVEPLCLPIGVSMQLRNPAEVSSMWAPPLSIGCTGLGLALTKVLKGRGIVFHDPTIASGQTGFETIQKAAKPVYQR